jgi:hypothetical protein
MVRFRAPKAQTPGIKMRGSELQLQLQLNKMSGARSAGVRRQVCDVGTFRVQIWTRTADSGQRTTGDGQRVTENVFSCSSILTAPPQ